MINSRCGIVAALAFLCCCSQSEADSGGFAGRPEAKRLEYVLYEDLPEDSEIVSFNQVGDSEGAFEIC